LQVRFLLVGPPRLLLALRGTHMRVLNRRSASAVFVALLGFVQGAAAQTQTVTDRACVIALV
ncbi:hypothetical protein, partial [Roseateles sp.]|uniref:hypothetical protein n=1 Tax=Roseateles sp. TaxID=1971397 RepID=UPI00286D5698